MPIGAAALMTMAQPAFAAVAEFNSKLLEGATRLNAEWAEFIGRRFQEDLAVPQRLAACKSPQEAQDVCIDYWKTAFAQYQDEIGRLTKMSQSLAQQTASSMQKHAEVMSQGNRIAA
jgi:hypothetical protein